jgi:hypothetical protein
MTYTSYETVLVGAAVGRGARLKVLGAMVMRRTLPPGRLTRPLHITADAQDPAGGQADTTLAPAESEENRPVEELCYAYAYVFGIYVDGYRYMYAL